MGIDLIVLDKNGKSTVIPVKFDDLNDVKTILLRTKEMGLTRVYLPVNNYYIEKGINKKEN